VLWFMCGLSFAFDAEYITNTTCQRSYKNCVSYNTAVAIQEAVHANAALYDVPETLVWQVMQVESRFNLNALSKTGARGLMQILPYWHRDKIQGRPINDIQVNVEVGVRLLKEYMNRYGNLKRALQAYVGSPKNLDYVRAVYAVRSVKYKSAHPLSIYLDTQDVHQTIAQINTHLSTSITQEQG
jgi:soluble lytic murein transglycosylase-like protein